MHKIQIRVDPSGMQGFTPAPKISFRGAQQCRNLAPYSGVGQAFFGAVHSRESKNYFLLIGKYNGLKNIHYLCQIGHSYPVAVIIENIQSNTCQYSIPHGILLK